MKNIAPPKLKTQLLLAGLTVTEMAITGILVLAGFFSGNVINAVFWAGTWLAFCARLYKGKSMRQILLTAIKYHITPQQFTRRITYHEKSNRHGKSHSV